MSNSLRSHGYTVHGILQTRILELVAFPFSRGSSRARDDPNPSLPHCRQVLYYLSHQRSPINEYLRISPMAQWVKNLLQCRRHGFDLWVRKISWKRKWQPTPVFLSGNPMARGAWRLQSMGSQKSWTGASLVAQRLKCLPAMWETRVRSLGWEDPLEKEMATHSSILAWRIPWREGPGRLQSTGSQRVRHD